MGSPVHPWKGLGYRSIRLVIAVSGPIIAGGCTNFHGGDYSKIFHYANQLWTGDGKLVTLKQAASVPYASIGVQIGDGAQTLLALAESHPRRKLWTSASHIVIVTRDGRIVQTAGLPKNLSSLSSGGAMRPSLALEQGGATFHFQADFSDLQAFATPIRCTAEPARPQTIRILGTPVQTRRVVEHCNTAALNWQFTNTFWIDPNSDLVWRSIQHIHPDFDPLEIETLRPPQADIAWSVQDKPVANVAAAAGHITMR